ncbi:hypothetical protein INR49_002587 [Caranx melampygus]|nr:hypothetical protein INR49_002587 [Caranx melampygus]
MRRNERSFARLFPSVALELRVRVNYSTMSEPTQSVRGSPPRAHGQAVSGVSGRWISRTLVKLNYTSRAEPCCTVPVSVLLELSHRLCDRTGSVGSRSGR